MTHLRTFLLTIASLTFCAATANAERLAATGSGGIKQFQVLCNLYNAGPGPIGITTKQIIGQFNGVNPLASDDCGTSLKEGGVCSFLANIPTGFSSYACNVVLAPSAGNVRGSMEIRDAAGAVLNSIGLN